MWRHYLQPVNKKAFEERLQELRNPKHDKFKHRKWKEEEKEFDKYLEEELNKMGKDDDTI